MAGPKFIFGNQSLYTLGTSSIRIILPEDRNCHCPDVQGYCHCAVRTGGNSLAGEVEVRQPGEGRFRVEVEFEGFCRTWSENSQSGVMSDQSVNKSEIRFLHEVDKTVLRLRSNDVNSGHNKHRVNFSFVVPKQLISARSDVDHQFLQLHPSTRLGARYYDYESRKPFAQPLIYYTLTATLQNIDTLPPLWFRQCEREIAILPAKTAEPPFYVGPHQQEYNLRSSVALRRHICGRVRGKLRLSAVEPPPLDIQATTPKASTLVPIKVEFVPNKSTDTEIDPYNWTVVVTSRIRQRVFCSTKRMERVPTLTDVRRTPQLELRTQSTEPEVRVYSHLSWRMDRLSKDGTIISTDTISQWIATLEATISASKTLQLPFTTPTATLRYSIVLEVRIVGLRHATASIEVPLQVLRKPPPDMRIASPVPSGWSQTSSDESDDLDFEGTVEDGGIKNRLRRPPSYYP